MQLFPVIELFCITIHCFWRDIRQTKRWRHTCRFSMCQAISNTACGATANETIGIRCTRANNARISYMRLGTSHKERHSYNRARTKIRCVVCHRWQDMPLCFILNPPRINSHQLACHHHHRRCAHQTPTQAQSTNPTSHLHAQPAVFHCGTHLPRKLSPHLLQKCSIELTSQSFSHLHNRRQF